MYARKYLEAAQESEKVDSPGEFLLSLLALSGTYYYGDSSSDMILHHAHCHTLDGRFNVIA